MKQGLPDNRYKVRIQCSTYNHAKYIEDALTGFSMQQTSFPFVCCVMDDASTDGEQEILKRWIDNHCNAEDIEIYDHPLTIVLKAPDRKNRNCIYAIHLLKYNTWGKPERRELLGHWRKLCAYEALCEGDDYWIDPLKLQRQVDFMEENSDYSICFHNAVILNERVENREKISSFCNFNKNQQISTQRLIEGWCIPTASVLYRVESLAQLKLPGFHSGDYTLELALASVGKVYYINRYMSVYRKNNGGVSVNISAKKWATQLCELLDWYDKYTANRYKKDIDKSKKNALLLAKYIGLKKKCILFPFLFMPYYTFQKLKRKFFN